MRQQRIKILLSLLKAIKNFQVLDLLNLIQKHTCQLKKAKDNFTKRFGADGNKNRPDYKKAATLKAKGGGGSRGEDGIVRGLGSDLDPKALLKSTKKSMDFRKGGMLISTVDNRKVK